MDVFIPFILDGLILFALLIAIVFSARLSLYLKTFRDSRRDLEGLVKELSMTIEKAENAIAGLKENSPCNNSKSLMNVRRTGKALSSSETNIATSASASQALRLHFRFRAFLRIGKKQDCAPLSLVKDSAPHLFKACLLYDFLFSQESQEATHSDLLLSGHELCPSHLLRWPSDSQ